MKIGIDARFVGPQGTGLGKYTEKLIENLKEIDKKNNYLIFLRRQNLNFLDFSKNKNFEKVLADVPWYTIEEQIKLPKIFTAQNLDVLHVPHFNAPIFYKGKKIVTIHDLIHHNFKESASTTKNPVIYRIKRFAYKKIISDAIYKSTKIIAPSNFVKEEIIKTFKVNPEKIVVTYEAAEDTYFSPEKSASVLKKYKIKTPFILYVGNAYPHKNLKNLLKAFAILVNSSRSTVHSSSKTVNREPTTDNLQIVIVCARDVFTKRLQKKIDDMHLTEWVTLTGYIEAEDLVKVFKSAEAYVFPSLSEGFGIPGLNAMAAGIPVASSNIKTLKEIYGPAALYFNPNDVTEIKEKIHQIITSQKTKDDLIKKGSEQVKKYSWRKMAEGTLAVYESI
ncbi:MAG: glycosyltransferase family 4 protein [Candidatus Curtissbacteria bacterium]|nr:glycosyltransferase family 4 protein [Candidatus Curtissbacteria bacterium]